MIIEIVIGRNKHDEVDSLDVEQEVEMTQNWNNLSVSFLMTDLFPRRSAKILLYN